MKTRFHHLLICLACSAGVLLAASALAQKPSPSPTIPKPPFQMPDMEKVWSQMAHAMYSPERAVELAHFQRLYYEALIKEGFTKEEALSIIRANPIAAPAR